MTGLPEGQSPRVGPTRHNPYTAIVITTTATLGVLFVFLVHHFHFTTGATTPSESALQDEDPVAVVKSILVNGAEQIEASQSEMKVTRVTAEVQGGQSGMLLVAGDEVSTGPNAKVTLLFLDAAPESDNEVLLDSNAQMRVGSIINLRGKILVRSKGKFDAVTQKIKLVATATEYELVVQPDGTNRIRVLDGAVQVEKSSFLSSITRDDSRRGLTSSGRQVNQTSTLVQELQQTVLGADGTLVKSSASTDEIDETLNWSNDVIVASQPTYSARSIIPRWQSWQERAQQFRVARRSAILNNDADSYEALGRIYVDWGNGAKAVDELRKAVSAGQTAERLTSLGEAYRLTGDLQRAQSTLMKTVREYPKFAPGLNALGNVYFDRAKSAKDKRQYEDAKKDLQTAKDYYARARINPTAAVSSETNLGEIDLVLGDIATEQGHLDDALNQYKLAEQTFSRVERIAGSHIFATKGLADVYRGMTKVARFQRDSALVTATFARSQQKYSQAIRTHRDMTEAYIGLGDLYEDNGRKEQAIREYALAIRVRPEVSESYYNYAVAISGRSPLSAGAYAKAYLKLEREVFKQGVSANTARLVTEHRPVSTPTPSVYVTPTPTASSISVPNVYGKKPDEALKTLRERGLEGQLKDQPDCKANGRVVATDPRRDTRVPPGTKVTVLISSLGENAVTVPQVTNKSLGEAQRELQRLGLVVDARRKRETNDVPENTVVSQYPKAYSRLNPGCTVELTTSIRIRLVEVPNYIGLTRQEAFKRLPRFFGSLIRGSVIEVDSGAPPGTVIDQSPKPGKMVPAGTTIDLVISRLQAKPPG